MHGSVSIVSLQFCAKSECVCVNEGLSNDPKEKKLRMLINVVNKFDR
jgi:hypothetical protein